MNRTSWAVIFLSLLVFKGITDEPSPLSAAVCGIEAKSWQRGANEEVHVKCKGSLVYDNLITIKTILKELTTDCVITFHQEVFNEKCKLLTISIYESH